MTKKEQKFFAANYLTFKALCKQSEFGSMYGLAKELGKSAKANPLKPIFISTVTKLDSIMNPLGYRVVFIKI